MAHSTCNCCYAISLQAQHVCVQNSMHQVNYGCDATEHCPVHLPNGGSSAEMHGMAFAFSKNVQTCMSPASGARLSTQVHHTLLFRCLLQNCPVCAEYLFDSVRPIAVLPCGHTIHQVSRLLNTSCFMVPGQHTCTMGMWKAVHIACNGIPH